MKKVLIVYATAGIGHVKAAFAIRDALQKCGKNISFELVDILDYSNFFLKWLYRKFYIKLVNRFPIAWAAIYYSLDHPIIFNHIDWLRSLIDRLNSAKFSRYLNSLKPDIIVSTHFFPSEVISYLKKAGRLNSYLISVITDYKLHTYWVSGYIDFFVAGDEAVKTGLKKWDIPENKISVLGIPIESKFFDVYDRGALQKKLGIKSELFTILIGSGGFGVGPIEGIIKELMKINVAIQLLVVCGKNKALYEDIRLLTQNSAIPIKIYGFIDNMNELMFVSDLLISKSGGMTVSEAIACELPMIITSPVPGQEMRNCDFVVENGAAVREDAPSLVREKVIEFYNNRNKLEVMRDSMRRIRKADPGSRLAEFITTL